MSKSKTIGMEVTTNTYSSIKAYIDNLNKDKDLQSAYSVLKFLKEMFTFGLTVFEANDRDIKKNCEIYSGFKRKRSQLRS